MMGMSMVMDMLPFLIVLVVVVEVVKIIVKYVKKLGSEKTEKDVRSNDERIYKMLADNAKSSKLKRHCDVYARGDSNIPMHHIGQTAVGCLVLPEAYVLPIREKWWKFWKDAKMLLVEREFIQDFYEGDIIIDAVDVDPLTEKFSWVNVSQEYGVNYGDEEVQEKRMKFFEKMFARLGDFDLNNDIWDNTKTGLRGSRASANKEFARRSKPSEKKVSDLERENREREKEIRREEEKGSVFNRRNY